MASSQKSKYILGEKRIRNDQEIQSILFMEEDSDNEESDNDESTQDEWIVQKTTKLIDPIKTLRVSISPLKLPVTSLENRKLKENELVSPIKIKRKLSYAVNKVSTPKKRPDIVSPILIKRISSGEVLSSSATVSKDCKLPTIVLDSSGEDEMEKSKIKRNARSKKSADTSSDDSDFEVSTPSKRKKTNKKKVLVGSSDESDVEEYTPSKRKAPNRKKPSSESSDSDLAVFTPSKRKTPSKKGKNRGTGANIAGSKRPTMKLHEKYKGSQDDIRQKVLRVEKALEKVLSISSSRPVRTPRKNSAEALSKADTTPVKGITPAKEAAMPHRTPSKGATLSKEATIPLKMTPAKGATPSKTTPSKPVACISLASSDEELEPSTPSSGRKHKMFFPDLNLGSIKGKEKTLKKLREEDVQCTPRRSLRLSQSPSTPSLRQRVLLANTPRPSLQVITDDESEEEKKTPRKSIRSAKKKLEMPQSTPVSARKVGRGFLSPAIADRDVRAPATPSSELGKARSQLQVSTLPKSLPCREKEFNDIKSFILRKVQDRTGGCMYISGVPGTGKTATLHAVVKDLQQMALDDDLPSFDFVEVNGLRLTEPRQAYVRIYQELSKNKATPDQALKHLETKFLGKPKRCTVLLVDELDYLCNKRQDVIYNILDWTTKQHSKLIVLTIANTMDLPERTLKGKVTSRMGLTRIVFQPYTFEQLSAIVMNRLNGCKAFHADAVQLVARKVAAVSGDARRALDICRRSTEILELEGRSTVSVLDIQRVLTQIFAGSRVQAIKNCSEMAKLVLRAIRDEVLRTGLEETSVAFICPQLLSVCALEGKKEPSVTSLLAICSDLADSGLIFAEKAHNDINRRISLNVSPDDIHYAINC